MDFDYSKLRGRIREVCSSESAFAERLGITSGALSHKLKGKTDFSQKQMRDAISILRIDSSSVEEYFFTPKVQKTELTTNDQQVG